MPFFKKTGNHNWVRERNKEKTYLFQFSLPVTANILTRSQIAVNFLHSQRYIKLFSAISKHLMKHSIICTSVPEHDNIITTLN